MIGNNLKALDRQRERQINRVVRRLKTLKVEVPDTKVKHHRKYYGFPYSYRGQFGGPTRANINRKDRRKTHPERADLLDLPNSRPL